MLLSMWARKLDEALQAGNPKLRAELQRTGQLQAFLEKRADRAEEQHNHLTAHLATRGEPLPKEHFARVQRLQVIDSQARELVFADLIEGLVGQETSEGPTIR